MLIRRVIIDNFGDIDHLEQRFNKKLTVVKGSNSQDLMLAMAWALSYPVQDINECIEKTREGCNIRLDTDDPKECELLNKSMLNSECRESLACRVFDDHNRGEFASKLISYKYPDDYIGPGRFAEMTDRFGVSKTFRAYLYEHIRNTSNMTPNKDYPICLNRQGEYVSNDNTKVDDLAFDFLCYLEINRFWRGASELHGTKIPKLPLLIRSDDIKDNSSILELAKQSNEQTIMFLN